MNGEEMARRSKLIDRSLELPYAAFVPVNAKWLADLRERQARPPRAIPTFLPTWNGACRDEGGGLGLARGWYVVVAGATGHGKTLMALNLTAAAVRQGTNVLYFSLEMSADQLITRTRAILAGEDIREVEWGEARDPLACERADERIVEAGGEVLVNAEPIAELGDIREVMAMAVELDDVGLFVVDYAQLVHSGKGESRRNEQVAFVSSQLRFMAQRLKVVTVALSQLNRSTSADRTAPPTVDGLYESGRLGNDADQVLILDHRFRHPGERERTEERRIVFAKNRHGPTPPIDVLLDKRTLQIREPAPGDRGDGSPVRWEP